MAIAISSIGTGTLPISGPGVISSVTVSNILINAGDEAFITLTGTVKDQRGPFDAYVSCVEAGSITVKANKRQLPETLSFNYLTAI